MGRQCRMRVRNRYRGWSSEGDTGGWPGLSYKCPVLLRARATCSRPRGLLFSLFSSVVLESPGPSARVSDKMSTCCSTESFHTTLYASRKTNSAEFHSRHLFYSTSLGIKRSQHDISAIQPSVYLAGSSG